MSGYGAVLLPQHAELLEGSGVTPEVAAARGYVSADTKAQLERLGFGQSQRQVPALVIPLHGVAGDVWCHQIRPDHPRYLDGKPAKYETPTKARMMIDVHPSMRSKLGDPKVPLIVTEGIRKGDAAVSLLDVPALSLLGVWSWRGRNEDDGLTALGDWEYVALNERKVIVCFDSDVMLKPQVEGALLRLGRFLAVRRAQVFYAYLPHGDNGAKVGLDDWLVQGHNLAELFDLSRSEPRAGTSTDTPSPVKVDPPPKRTLAEVLAVFRHYMRLDDPAPLYAVLAAYAANRIDGDPVWLGVVGGSGRGKTELVMALAAADRVALASSITGEAALLSATSQRERSATATGGLLARLGDHGLIVLKDFTTILSMHREARAQLLGAFREVYDGKWTREVGTDGGRTLSWAGKIGLVFGCTTAIDSAHAVMASMGERFLLVRVPIDPDAELAAAALAQVGGETSMRREMSDVAAGLLAHLDYGPRGPVEGEQRAAMIALAGLVARSRSPVERDQQGEIVLVGDPEAPTRLIKALDRLRAGLLVIGLDESEAWRVTCKVGLDSIPKLRRAVLDYFAGASGRRTTKVVAQALEHPTKTVGRTLQDLAAHGVLVRESGAELKSAGDSSADGRADYWELSDWARAAVVRSKLKPETSEDHHVLCPSTSMGPIGPEHTNDDITGLNIHEEPAARPTDVGGWPWVACGECGEEQTVKPGTDKACVMTPGCTGRLDARMVAR